MRPFTCHWMIAGTAVIGFVAAMLKLEIKRTVYVAQHGPLLLVYACLLWTIDRSWLVSGLTIRIKLVREIATFSVFFAGPLIGYYLWRAAENHRQRIGQELCCKHCGYSLTGNTSGVCPECGMAVMKAENDRAAHPFR